MVVFAAVRLSAHLGGGTSGSEPRYSCLGLQFSSHNSAMGEDLLPETLHRRKPTSDHGHMRNGSCPSFLFVSLKPYWPMLSAP